MEIIFIFLIISIIFVGFLKRPQVIEIQDRTVTKVTVNKCNKKSEYKLHGYHQKDMDSRNYHTSTMSRVRPADGHKRGVI